MQLPHCTFMSHVLRQFLCVESQIADKLKGVRSKVTTATRAAMHKLPLSRDQ